MIRRVKLPHSVLEQVKLAEIGKAGPTGHKRVVAVADRIVGDVSQVRRGGGGRSRPVGLLRHSFRLVDGLEDKLRTIYVASFEGVAVPGGRLRSGRKNCPGRIVRRATGGSRAGGSSIAIRGYCAAITLSEIYVIRPVLSHHVQVEVGAEVELAVKAHTTESLVANSRTGDRHPARSQIVGCCLSYKGVCAETLRPQLARIKTLVEGKEPAIGVGSGNQAHAPIVRTEHGGGNARPIVHRVSHVLDAELVVAHLAEGVSVT